MENGHPLDLGTTGSSEGLKDVEGGRTEGCDQESPVSESSDRPYTWLKLADYEERRNHPPEFKGQA